MADAALEPESAKGDAGPERPGDDAAPERPEDEIKRKFRAALDRKRSQLTEHNNRQAGRGGGKVQGAHGPAQSRRSFRRKSGG